jgi:hypothetical protein
VDAFATWRRRPVQIVPQFPLWATWTDVEIPASWLAYWSERHPRYQLAVRIAMMPQHSGVTLSKVATGRFDWRYRLAARHLVSAGLGDAVIRIGHEFNGEAYPWAAQGHAAAYAAAFKHIVRAMRSQPGEHFLFDWNVALTSHNWDATTAYPGDGYVDEIGVDLYDKHPGSAQTPGDRWNYLVAPTDGSRQGLDFWSKFAHDHGKPLAVPEWGLEVTGDANGGGGGDDPTFIGHMAAWLKSHTVSWEAYFNKNATDGTHQLDDFPSASAQYLACFGEPRPNPQPASSANRFVHRLAPQQHRGPVGIHGDDGRPGHLIVRRGHRPAVGTSGGDGQQVAGREVARQPRVLHDDVTAFAVLADDPHQHGRRVGARLCQPGHCASSGRPRDRHTSIRGSRPPPGLGGGQAG